MATQPKPFWLDRPDAPPARERLRGEASCDLTGRRNLWLRALDAAGLGFDS
jgi:hypothetical protein